MAACVKVDICVSLSVVPVYGGSTFYSPKKIDDFKLRSEGWRNAAVTTNFRKHHSVKDSRL